MLTRSQLKEVFERYGFRPLKRLGANYLVDANIKDKIVAEACLSKDDIVLEIGPGLGALTIDLARSGASVTAVEIDRKAVGILAERAGADFPNLAIVHGDILKFDLCGLGGKRKVKVIGNLPYYITTPIIEWLIGHASRIDFALVMVQREVANRLMAEPGSKEYSSISCFVQYHTRPAYIHTVKKAAFCPEPDVDSSIIRFDFPERPTVKVADEKLLFTIIRSAFNQRRKSLINSLSREAALDMPKERLSAILAAAGIDPSARPETLSLTQFASIADHIHSS